MTQPDRGLLDSSAVVLLSRLRDASVLPVHPLISAMTLAELTVGPLVAFTGVFYSQADAPAVLRGYRDYFRDAPDEVTPEAISITIPETEEKVSILGEKVTQERLDAGPTTYSSPGRPVAVISDVMIEYTPPPPPRPAPVRRQR